MVPRMAIFLAGIAAGALTLGARRQNSALAAETKNLQTEFVNLQRQIAAQEAANAERFNRVEKRLEDHATRLADVPSTTQIIGAMEELLSRTLASLDDRLVAHAKSIDTLKTTVSQTDALLGRVLESLDPLELSDDVPGKQEPPLYHRPRA